MSRRRRRAMPKRVTILADERASRARKSALDLRASRRTSPAGRPGSAFRDFAARWLPALLWTGVVLGFSLEAFAATQTSRVLIPLLRGMFPWADPETLELLHLVIRKLAHADEYAIQAVLFVRAWSGRLSVEGTREVGHALLVVALVAAVDEYRQSFSAVRTGSLRDWGIDLGGALVALVVLWAWQRASAKIRMRSDGAREVPGGRRGGD